MLRKLRALIILAGFCAACGGAPPVAGDVHERMCEMNPLAVSCGAAVEQSSEALGTPHFVVGPDAEWSYRYSCPGNPTEWTMHLTPDVAVSSPLHATTVQLDSESYRAPGIVTLAGFTESLTNDMDGPYHIAYTTQGTVACFGRENTVQGDCSNLAEIPAWGIWIYAAGERADYPRGIAVVTMDPHWIGGDGLYDSVGRCSVRKQIYLPL